jgi:hypothetical protein
MNYFYASEEKDKKSIPILPLIILASLFITFVSEGIFYYFSQDLFGPLVFVSSFIFRTVSTFLIVYFLFSKFSTFFVPQSIRDNVTSPSFSINKLKFRKTKVFFLSVGFVGIPNLLLMFPILNLILFVSGGQLDSLYSKPNETTAMFLIADFLRMSALVLAIRMLYSGAIRKWSSAASISSIVAGFLHIWLFSYIVLASIPPDLDSEIERDKILIPIYVLSVFFMGVGLTEIIWPIVIIKSRRSIWFGIGILGSIIIILLWLVTIATMPALTTKIQSLPISFEIYYDLYTSLYPLIFVPGIAIILSQIAFIITSTIAREREKNKVEKEDLTTDILPSRIISKVRANKLLLVLSGFLLLIVTSTLLSANSLSSAILVELDNSVPDKIHIHPVEIGYDVGIYL